jgi:GntR family transcriptional regulator
MDYAFSLSEVERLDSESFTPLYMQLADRISRLIEHRGEAAIGKFLPSETECVQHFNVSRPTVRQAMNHLSYLGLIVREKGRGTFVAPRLSHHMSHGFEDEMKAGNRNVQARMIEWRRMHPPEAVRSALHLPEHEDVWFLRRLRVVDGVSVGNEDRYFPKGLGERISERDAKSEPMLALLKKVTGERSTHVEIDVTSGTAGRELGRLLGVKSSASVLAKRLTYFFNGKPLAYGSTTFLSEHYQFRLSINLPI